ncbi:unnamed protein product [Eruca vesicaria subsp. sativa]|uniref:Uncharacterized protein n=1 Tax=Eruca vesicaria subsp. sativa TaxID=29727 RepID=A0ABC8LYH2_ERUVS|nr:unnamed protein product [Eruca vesicaria subsp. sativa]
MNTFSPAADERRRSPHRRKIYIPSVERSSHQKSKGFKVSARKLASRLHKLPPIEDGSLAERFSHQMEGITKWDLGSFRTYDSVEPYEKFQVEENLDGSLVPRLAAELWKAQQRVKELETKENRCLIRSQRISTMEEEEDTDSLFDYLKEKLSKEKEERKRANAENSRLKKKILEMESTISKLRRERDTLEKVCEELVTRIDELKAETRRIWDETKEERQMLQMAEMWREERVRVKLTDAKLSLQEKFEEMNWFVDELEKCLEMARDVGGTEGLRRGERLIKTVRSLEDEANDIEFEKFKFASDDDN